MAMVIQIILQRMLSIWAHRVTSTHGNNRIHRFGTISRVDEFDQRAIWLTPITVIFLGYGLLKDRMTSATGLSLIVMNASMRWMWIIRSAFCPVLVSQDDDFQFIRLRQIGPRGRELIISPSLLSNLSVTQSNDVRVKPHDIVFALLSRPATYLSSPITSKPRYNVDSSPPKFHSASLNDDLRMPISTVRQWLLSWPGLLQCQPEFPGHHTFRMS
jgi:hypothetical protein